MRKLIAAGLMGLALLASPAKAADGVTEVMVSDKKVSLDAKLFDKIGDRGGYFVRHRSEVDYEGSVSPFTLMDLSYGLGAGVDAVIEGQFTPGGFDPRVGGQYFGQFGDLGVYALATVGPKEDVEVVVDAKYKTSVTDGLDVFGEVESVINATREDLGFAAQRLRAGIGVGEFEIGAAVDCVETGDDPIPKCVYGVAVRR